jgi:hypothetical protein
MKKRMCLTLAAALAVCGLAGVSQASAATEFGSGCGATGYFREFAEISTGHGAGSPLPVAAPVSGVITEYKINVGQLGFEEEEGFEAIKAPKGFYTQLFVVSPAGTNQYKIVGKAESGLLSINTVNTFPARIPVQAGDLLGLGGSYAPTCQTEDPVDVASDFTGVPPIGATPVTEPYKGFQVPVTAKIEPDVDGDGYGDETQDKCPQSAAYQTPCPVITLGGTPVAGKKAVTYYASSSLSASVAVTATVALPKGKKATLNATTATVAPGAPTPFTLTLNKSVTKVLQGLPKSKTLAVTITASANNLTGAPSVATSTVKLRGQAGTKPAAPKKSNTKYAAGAGTCPGAARAGAPRLSADV